LDETRFSRTPNFGSNSEDTASQRHKESVSDFNKIHTPIDEIDPLPPIVPYIAYHTLTAQSIMMLKRIPVFLLAAPVAIDAFTAPQIKMARRTALSAMGGDDNDRDESLSHAIRNLAASSAVTLALIMPTTAIAQDNNYMQTFDNGIYSSTVTLSEVIKTMDFSLPSSYDTISDPVASGVDELTIYQGKTQPKKVEKKKEPKKATSVNKGFSLPSFGGDVSGEKPTINSDAFKPKTAEEKAAVLAARRAEREEAAATALREKAEAEKQAAAERDANIKAARLEKIAKREEEAAKKAAEESAKRDEMFKDVKVVDTSMPQY
jgi:hypothetical protein